MTKKQKEAFKKKAVRLVEIRLKMQTLRETSYDVEVTHKQADDLLCEALELYGEVEMVEDFNAMQKWYA